MPEGINSDVDELRQIAEALVLSGLRARDKAAEAAQSETVLRALLNGLDAIIWEADAVTWQYSFVSRQAEQFLGYPGGEWLARRDFWAEVIHPLDRVQTLESWRTGICRGGQFTLEYRALTADSRMVWLRNMVSVNAGPDGNPQALRGVIIDVTERNQADAEMAAAHWRDHRIAETLQQSMLLKPGQDRFSGLDIETFYEPCWEEAQVGGDFFDIFVPSPGKVALVVGDVCGKGLIAAARTVQVKYALRAFLHNQAPPLALYHLNNYLAAGMEDEEFVALCVAVLDLASGETIFVAAGAEPPLVLRAENAVVSLDVGGMPLGVDADVSYDAVEVQFQVGDTLLMTTDGISEARRDGAFLGPEGLTQMAQDAATLSLKAMGQAVLDGARAFAQGAFRDDVCMLLARRR